MPADKKTGDEVLAVVAAPARPKAQVQADLDRAQSKLADLLPKIEADRERVTRQAQRIALKKQQWKVEFPDMPFDPDGFSIPMRPFEHNEELNREFHQVHYEIEKYETELSLLAKAKGQAL